MPRPPLGEKSHARARFAERARRSLAANRVGLAAAPVSLLMRRAGGLLLAAGLAFACPAHAQMIQLTVGPGGDFATLGAMAQAQISGNTYVVTIVPGTYVDDFAVFQADTVLNGTGVTEIADTQPPNLKGLFTTTFSLTVNDMALIAQPGFGIDSSLGGNAALIREQSNGATQLNVNDAVIEGGQMGILTGSDSGNTHLDQVTITNTRFVNNGNPDPAAFGHALYVGDAASLTVTGSLFCGQLIGHDVKSRAMVTMVSGSTLFIGTNQGADPACNIGSASLAVDAPNGGQLFVSSSSIFQDEANQNGSLIRFGEEGLVFADNALSVTNTAFTNYGVRPSTAIDELSSCITPVIGVGTDTFVNIAVPVMPPNCVAPGCVTPSPANN